MKKAGLIMIILTLIFCGFAGGFFLGRSFNNNSIQVSAIPTSASATDATVPTEQTEPTTSFPLNINTATETELCELPGIGPTLAQRIVAYRQENGPFENLADLLLVKGIGQKTLEDILDYITIGG